MFKIQKNSVALINNPKESNDESKDNLSNAS